LPWPISCACFAISNSLFIPAISEKSGPQLDYNPKTGQIEEYTVDPFTGEKKYKPKESDLKIDFNKIDYSKIQEASFFNNLFK